MDLSNILEALHTKIRELRLGLPIEWHIPPSPPRNPINARIKSTWHKVGMGKKKETLREGKNYRYAEVAFPEKQCGVPLSGTTGQIVIMGLSPFTLWIDGEELFKESHAWHATGPICDPVPVPVEPGKKMRLTLCIEAMRKGGFGVAVQIRSQECYELSVELDAAAFQLQLASDLAQTEKEHNLVARAADCLDLRAIRANRWKKALASIADMENTLAPLSPKARELTVHLLGHSHIDMDWLWTWKDTVHCVRRDLKAAVDMMDDYPDLTFTHSQIPTYDVVRNMDRNVFQKIKERIAEGRWEVAAGTWVEGDLNMADGESIARHMLYASDWSLKHLGSKSRVVWEPDTFGHSGNMPQLVRLGEHDTYFHMRCNPGGEQLWPIRIWEGIDGTKLTTLSNIYGGSLEPAAILSSIRNARRLGLKTVLHVWGMGDHGGGISRFQIRLMEQYRDKPLIPQIIFSTTGRILEAVKKKKEKLPTNKGETFTIFEGCYTTHSRIKKYNRDAEGALLTAETLCAMAGMNRNDALRNAWIPTLFNHFHDIFDGAAISESYLDAHRRGAASLRNARRIGQEALETLVKTSSKTGKSLIVVNTLGFSRTEPVRAKLPKGTKCLIDDKDRPIPVQMLGSDFVFIAEGIPAFSTKSYRILEKFPSGTGFANIAVSDDKIGPGDPYFRVETGTAVIHIARQSGAIAGYFDKSLQRQFIDHGLTRPVSHAGTTRADLAMNVFQVIDEAPHSMTAWMINDNLKQENLLRGADVKLLDNGPVFTRLRVKHAFRSSKIIEEIILYQNFPRVDFEVKVDWREVGNATDGVPQLKVSFASAMTTARARFEGPFLVRELPADGQERPTQKWGAVTGSDFGFALLNDCKHGYDALGGRMRITLLRNSFSPDPNSDNGIHTMRFAFQPHDPSTSNAQLVRDGMAFNRACPTVCAGGAPFPAHPRLNMEGADSVICSAMRIAEHSERLLIRFHETSGKRAQITFSLGNGIRSAEEVNFLENPTGGKVEINKGKVTTSFRPWEVKTFLIECSDL